MQIKKSVKKEFIGFVLVLLNLTILLPNLFTNYNVNAENISDNNQINPILPNNNSNSTFHLDSLLKGNDYVPKAEVIVPYNNFLFVSAGSSSIYIFNISDISEPMFWKTVNVTIIASGHVIDLVVIDHYQSSNRVMSKLGKIDWYFHSQNNFVKLDCMIMDKENFDAFELLQLGYSGSYRYFPVSDGDKYSDSGLWPVSHRGEYYVVVMHDDSLSSGLSTFAALHVDFIGGYISVFLLIVLIIVPLGIAGLVFGLIIRSKKRGKQELSAPQLKDNDSLETQVISKDVTSKSVPENIFCWKCGIINSSTNVTCTNCGEYLKPKD